MNSGYKSGVVEAPERAEGRAKKTICIDEEVLRKGLVRAEREDRSFSNYVTWLIRRDLGEAPLEEKEAVNG